MKKLTFVKASSYIVFLPPRMLSKLNNDSISATSRHILISFERYDCPKIGPKKSLQHFSLHLCKSKMKSFQGHKYPSLNASNIDYFRTIGPRHRGFGV